MSETAKKMAAMGLLPIPHLPGCYAAPKEWKWPRGPVDTTEIRRKFEAWKLSQQLPQKCEGAK